HELMPIEKKYALPDVVQALSQFRRRVTLEYVLIGGKNDSLAQADQLAKLARPLGALVNLLPLHPGGAPDLTPSDRPRMIAFERRLKSHGGEAGLAAGVEHLDGEARALLSRNGERGGPGGAGGPLVVARGEPEDERAQREASEFQNPTVAGMSCQPERSTHSMRRRATSCSTA